MAQTYDQRQELLARLWTDLKSALTTTQIAQLDSLPEPCRNHVEDRLSKPERGLKLQSGLRRLAGSDAALLLEGLRLHPHAVCRTAETIGPIPESLWSNLRDGLSSHRLWVVASSLETSKDTSQAFWQAMETLAPYRELPQSLIDFLEEGRPRTEAPWPEFSTSLCRFLVRARLEKLRFQTYAALRGQGSQCSDT